MTFTEYTIEYLARFAELVATVTDFHDELPQREPTANVDKSDDE